MNHSIKHQHPDIKRNLRNYQWHRVQWEDPTNIQKSIFILQELLFGEKTENQTRSTQTEKRNKPAFPWSQVHHKHATKVVCHPAKVDNSELLSKCQEKEKKR